MFPETKSRETSGLLGLLSGNQLFPSGPYIKCVIFTSPSANKYRLLTKCEVKMAGYWPSSFFACLWTETESRSINTQKKNSANVKPS